MKTKIILLFILVFYFSLSYAAIRPDRLSCENIHNPMVVDILKPRLSWINNSDENERGQYQTAWEIRVASSENLLFSGNPDLWTSGKVLTEQSVNIQYSGKALSSGQDCWWQVRVWDRKDKVSDWSDPAFWSMGLLSPDDWKARWIGAMINNNFREYYVHSGFSSRQSS